MGIRMKLLGLKKNWKQWLSLFCLCVGGGTIYKLPYIRDVFYVQFQEAFGATNTQMGLMMTVYAITCAVSFLPGGWLPDLIPAKYLVSIGLFTTGATGLLLMSIPPMSVVLLAQGIFGITTTLLFWEAMFKGVRILGSAEEQGRLFGLLEGGRGIASTLISFAALAVCAKLGEGKLGMQGTIIFYSVVLMLLGVMCFFLMDKNPVEGKINARECLAGMVQVLKLPKVWLAGLIVFCGYASYQCLSYFTPYLVDVYGMSASMGSVISIIRTYILAIIIAPIGGALADKKGSKIKFLQYIYVIGIILALLPVFIVPGDGTLIPMVIVMLCVAATVMVLRGIYYSTTAEINIPVVLAGAALGIMSQLGNAPDFFLQTMCGWFIDSHPGRAGYQMVFITMASLCVFGMVFCMILYWTNKREMEKEKKVDFKVTDADIL
ncbi:MAG: MFS transporter [Lachnospiraceae bacterium]|nr:MFS transporter [Lachnospiraceae bacterium]